MVSNRDFVTENEQQPTPEFQELESPEGEPHLRFYIPSGEELALPATGIKEVIVKPPDQITPIPNTSPLLLGTLNLRGRVIWVGDLGQFLLGEAAVLNTDRSEIHVIAIEDQDTILGLAVEKIVDMDWLDVDQIQMSSNIPDSMAPFLHGEWLLDEQSGRYLRLLDNVAILRAARWAP